MTRHGKIRIAFLWGILAAGVAVLYFVIDPATSRFMPKCLFKVVTGMDCPGCGSQRMLHSLLRGDLGEAWHYNALFVALIPVLIFLLVVETGREKWPKFYLSVFRPWLSIAFGVLLAVWWIARNIFLW